MLEMDATAQLIGSLFSLKRVIRQRLMKMEQLSELNIHQMHTLLCIFEHPRLTMSELATMLRISQSSATSLVSRLQRMGFLQRRADRKNRKLIRVSLTPRGASVLKKTMRQSQLHMKAIFSHIPANDRATMARILTSLVTVLQSDSHS